MAKCEEGYLCEVCGGDVERLSESDLYLRFVIGWVDPETLHVRRERHLKCNPILAQFVVADDFPTPVVEGEFDKRRLDPEHVRERESLVTRGWMRLREVEGSGLPIIDYPLDEVRQRIEAGWLGHPPDRD
ncbi:MAG TPA: hypothetical protein PLI18_02410 [Pirellulaceae bacterium]|nr:hypothetical protein [Pirellulaceae bacterium]